jgi:hypothetical protein
VNVCCAVRGLCNGPIPLPEKSVSLNAIRRNSGPVHLQWLGRRCQEKKERERKEIISLFLRSIQMRNYCLLVKYKAVSVKIDLMAPVGYSYH